MTDKEKSNRLEIHMKGFVDAVTFQEHSKLYPKTYLREFDFTHKAAKEIYDRGWLAGRAAWQADVDKIREELKYRLTSEVMAAVGVTTS